MKLPRRHFSIWQRVPPRSVVSRVARARTYPTRPVHVIVGYAPAGTTDVFVRLLCQSLSERLGQSFVVDNKPGAASNIATEAVVRAAADGYTLIATDGAAAINATLYDKLNFNFVRDIAVVGMSRAPLVLVVHPSVPAKTVPEFIAYAKDNSGRIAMASSGTGAPPHLAGELFKMMAGVAMTHVPYRGAGPATTDLIGGQVQVMFNGVAPSIEYIRSGRLRALAVTTVTRSAAMPEIPSISEFIPGYEMSNWYAVGLRKDTPADIVDKLNHEINAALTDPKMTARLADLVNVVFSESSANLGRFVAQETEKLAKVVRTANLKPE